MKKIFVYITLLVTGAGSAAYLAGCHKLEGPELNPTYIFPPVLSTWNIFEGDPIQLVPKAGLVKFQPATALFSDYAEKQRLVRVPGAQRLAVTSDDLLTFPDSSLLVKTFYYFKDLRNPALGKQLVETRLLFKIRGRWNAATYVWNAAATEANLATTSSVVPIGWVDERGASQQVRYVIPSLKDCGSCHKTGREIVPIAPKVRNLNHDIAYGNGTINQLTYMQAAGILGPVSPPAHGSLPAWDDPSFTREERARAYLDINCAHCHKTGGLAGDISSFRPGYEIPFDQTRIRQQKDAIRVLMERKLMPKTGTTVVHQEAMELVRQYLQSL
jgi:uncharacterized repeat protein (TIGR03806 family)